MEPVNERDALAWDIIRQAFIWAGELVEVQTALHGAEHYRVVDVTWLHKTV